MGYVNAKFVSVWDDGVEIRTDCMFDPETKRVSDIETEDVSGLNLDILVEEFVEVGDVQYRDFIVEDEE